MKPTENDIALVERFFDAELNEDEKKKFVLRIEQDEAFRALVQREKIIIGAIRSQGLTDNLQYLKSIEEKLEHSHPLNPHPGIKKWYYYAVAACIVLFVVVRFLLPSQRETSDQLFADYFKAYPNVFEPTVRGADVAVSSKRTQAFQAYDQGNYERASLLFIDLLKEREEAEILFLLGNSNLMLGNIDQAQKNFVTLIQEFDDLDLQAKWYLSLCYLKNGDKENARKILRELGKTEISYAAKAKELLEKVE